MVDQLRSLLSSKTAQTSRRISDPIITGAVLAVCAGITIAIFQAVGFGTYSTDRYYRNFIRYSTNQIGQEEYYQSFNRLMRDNYQLAHFLKNQKQNRLFIWGNNAMLYALSETIPTSRYTVAFHVLDMGAFGETMSQLKKEEPKYIVLMKNAPRDFPEFYEYLSAEYMPNHSYEHMTLYKRISYKQQVN